MSLPKLVLAFIISAAIVSGVFIAMKDTTPEAPLGANPGPEYLDVQYFRGDAIVGGANLATTSQGTATYTGQQVMVNKVITHTAPAALTVTLPASSTLSQYIPKTGDTKTLFIVPITTLITVAGASGMDLNSASTSRACGAGLMCRLEFVRKANTDIEVFMDN